MNRNRNKMTTGRSGSGKSRFLLRAVIPLLIAAVVAGCGSGAVETEAAQAQETAQIQDAPGAPAEAGGVIAEIRTGSTAAESGQAETSAPAPAETEPDYASMVTGKRYTISNVNVRAGAGTSASVLATLEPGTEVPLISDADETWAEVLYQGGPAYISREFLTDDPDWQAHLRTRNGYANGEAVSLNDAWTYADHSKIHSDSATMYVAVRNRKNLIIGVNAGHGTEGGSNVRTLCHPDGSAKVTGGSTAAGSIEATAVSTGMTFNDGTPERKVTLAEAKLFRDKLLDAGYDVLMIREGDDVQLDNVARTVICNNVADCHIAIHWDGDGLSYDKGCFYMSVPDGVKHFENVAAVWEESEALGDALIRGLSENGLKIMGDGTMDMDLTQTCYSFVPSIDIELGNQCSDHSDAVLDRLAEGLVKGIDHFYGFG